ncbi:MAG: hypothetical protein ACYDA9_07105 [Terriglobia bacterium]
MRYQKGSIRLNRIKDKAILHFVADSRYATRWQLNSFALLDYCELNRRVFNWRLQRLVETGLMRKQMVPFLDGEALYSITRPGVEALEQLGVYYLGGNFERNKDAREFQIPHSLELNSIWLTLMATGKLLRWIPEVFIRVLNMSPANAYAKVYDGIARVVLDGKTIEFAIEYERTLKSQPKYEKIRDAIESEKRLNAFLYLMPAYPLLWSLMSEYRGTKRLVFFGLNDEFKEKNFTAPVWTPAYDKSSLQDALVKVAALARKQS